MTRYLLLFLLLATLGGCASLPWNKPRVDRVVEVEVYVAPADDLLVCQKPLALTEEQIAAIKLESELSLQWILKAYERHKECYQNNKRLRAWKDGLNDQR